MVERFEFGKNWQSYIEQVTPEAYAAARASVAALAGDLKGKTFLDVGCGSGLFSIAAASLGARQVVAFDYDPDSVAAAGALLAKVAAWDPAINKDRITFQVGDILADPQRWGRHDVVYSWGVLHHTGAMYQAFENVSRLVADNGLLVLAIYNKHFTSPVWKGVKYAYNRGGRLTRRTLVALVAGVKFFGLLVTGQHPFRKARGMSYRHDIVDWVGGYPYEYATIDEVVGFFTARGFAARQVVRTAGFTGCNQFVFQRVQACAE